MNETNLTVSKVLLVVEGEEAKHILTLRKPLHITQVDSDEDLIEAAVGYLASKDFFDFTGDNVKVVAPSPSQVLQRTAVAHLDKLEERTNGAGSAAPTPRVKVSTERQQWPDALRKTAGHLIVHGRSTWSEEEVQEMMSVFTKAKSNTVRITAFDDANVPKNHSRALIALLEWRKVIRVDRLNHTNVEVVKLRDYPYSLAPEA